MKLNKKGFSMVEIIATVAILGILSVIGIVSVNSIIERGKEEHYVSAEKALKMTAESYAQANRNYLPKNVGEMRKVTLKQLVEDNYIEQIKDYYDKECYLEESYVQIFKYSKTDYSYLPYLKCPDYSNFEENETKKPTISINFTEATKNTVKQTVAKTKIEDPDKILSYSITIFKNGAEVYTTGNVEANYEKIINKTNDISKYTPGTIKVTVKATNIFGQTTTYSKEQKYEDKQGPTCIIAAADTSRTSDDWIAANRTITVGCDDGPDGSGCARDEFTKTFKNDAQTDFIIIKDKAGNETACEVDVYIDKTKPNACTVTHSGTKGTNQWYVTNASVSLNAEDAMSGIKYKSLTTESTKPATYNQLSSGIQTDTTGIVWYGYVEDYAGNKTNCFSTNFKVDTTAPTQPNGGSITISGSTAATTLGAVAGSTDATSGVKEYRYVVKNNDTVPTNGDSGFTTSRSFTRSCGTSYYAYAIAVDNAGNKSTVHLIGSGSDNKNEYVNYSKCTKQCDTGTQTASNECALITEPNTRNCNTRKCCTDTTVAYKDGTTCSETCGTTGTLNRIAYSTYDSSVLCPTYNKTSGGSACGRVDCCSQLKYEDGTQCSEPCGPGNKNRLAYSKLNGQRCSGNDDWSGGACNLGSCSTPVNDDRYSGCDQYYITSCASGNCTYTIKNAAAASGTIAESSLSTTPDSSCTKYHCNAYISSVSSGVVKFTVTQHDGCKVQSYSTGSCSKGGSGNYWVKAGYSSISEGSYCGIRVDIATKAYIWKGTAKDFISWETYKCSGGKYCTQSCSSGVCVS